MTNKEITKELKKALHQFARFAVIGFRGIKEGQELKYFDKYVKDDTRIKILFEQALKSQQKEIIEKIVKYVRSGKLAGSFSEGCDCEKCDEFEKKIKKKFLK